jgi:hypothetical protein
MLKESSIGGEGLETSLVGHRDIRVSLQKRSIITMGVTPGNLQQKIDSLSGKSTAVT